jgi:putative solute:sodium symporter small subunit
MNPLPWRRVLRRTLLLLSIWFVGGPLLGILVVDRLNTVQLGDLPLGFWIAQQGAIYLFVILIFLNAWLADRESRNAGPAGAGLPGAGPGDPPLQRTPAT